MRVACISVSPSPTFASLWPNRSDKFYKSRRDEPERATAQVPASDVDDRQTAYASEAGEFSRPAQLFFE